MNFGQGDAQRIEIAKLEKYPASTPSKRIVTLADCGMRRG
jgi:hypothetical protein